MPARVLLVAFLLASGASAGLCATPWPMFHADERHTGVSAGQGAIPASGPSVRWTYQVTSPPTTHDFASYRWTSSFPLGDLDGDGTLEVVVTSPDNAAGTPPRVMALKDVPLQIPPVQPLWTWVSPGGLHAGVDQYSAALVDCDGDGLLDVVFTSKDHVVRALKGNTGALLWQFDTGRPMESGPMVADLDGDGQKEIIVVTDCAGGGPQCPAGQAAALYVFAPVAASAPANPPLWSLELPWKTDSAEPAIADLDPTDGTARKAIVLGSWGARLTVVWRNANGTITSADLDVRTLDGTVSPGAPAAVRTAPLVADFGSGPTAVFGWMPDPTVGTAARLSAVGIVADMTAQTVAFMPRWTVARDTWQSSPALVPIAGGPPRVAAGYGIGTADGTASFGSCDAPTGGVVAVAPDGQVAWDDPLANQGSVRGAPAVADLDGDGQADVLVPVGCFGMLAAYDGATGAPKWGYQLGPRTLGSPSIGDLDGDGALEIVACSYDGKVYALGAPGPPTEQPLLGKSLSLRVRAGAPAKATLAFLSADPSLNLGVGNGTGDDPTVAGGSLRLATATGDGFDAAYDLPARNWSTIGRVGANKGYRYRDGLLRDGPVNLVIIRRGQLAKVLGRGAGLRQTLRANPDPVRLVLGIGRHHYCASFGGTVAFKADQVYVGKNAPAPGACPP